MSDPRGIVGRMATRETERLRADPAARARKLARNREWWARNAAEIAKRRKPDNRVRRLDRYGMTRREFESLLVSQGEACAICRRRLGRGRYGAQVDHDHRTGKVRGLLCNPCNRAIGLLRDDPAIVDAAARYLRRLA